MASTATKKTKATDRIRANTDKIAAALRGGATMKAQKAEYGVNSDVPIREALARAGFDSKGAPLTVKPIKANGTRLAARLIEKRQEGEPWYLLSIATGRPESELRTLVEKAGGPTGRVYRKSDKPATAKEA